MGQHWSEIEEVRRNAELVPKALRDTLISPNEADSNFEPANVVDGLFAIARSIHHLARAIEGSEEEE